jgi:hypothetical protein
MRKHSAFRVPGSRLTLCVILYLLSSIPGLAQNPVVQYPVAGNFRPERGTIELWLRFAEQPEAGAGRSLHYFPVFFLDREGENTRRVSFTYQTIWGTNHFHFFFSSVVKVEGGMMQGPYVASAEEGQTVKPSRDGPPPFLPRMKAGDWHHLAIVWTNGLEKTLVSMYLDGRLAIRPSELPGPWWDDMETMTFSLMNAPYHDNIAFDELRVSDIARPAEAIADAFARGSLVRDEHTLLLDRFEQLDENETIAEWIAGYRGEKGGRLLNRCYELVDGKFGRALRTTAAPKP